MKRPAGIELGEPAERPGRYLVCRYETTQSSSSSYFSSAALAAAVAKHLPSTAPDGWMDLRQMGAFWLGLWVLLLILFLRGGLTVAEGVDWLRRKRSPALTPPSGASTKPR